MAVATLCGDDKDGQVHAKREEAGRPATARSSSSSFYGYAGRRTSSSPLPSATRGGGSRRRQLRPLLITRRRRCSSPGTSGGCVHGMKRPQITLPEGVMVWAPVDLILHAEMGGGAKLSRGRAPPELGCDGAPTAATDTVLACHHRAQLRAGSLASVPTTGRRHDAVLLLSHLAPSKPATPAPWSSARLLPCFPTAGRRGAILLLSRLAPSTPTPPVDTRARPHLPIDDGGDGGAALPVTPLSLKAAAAPPEYEMPSMKEWLVSRVLALVSMVALHHHHSHQIKATTLTWLIVKATPPPRDGAKKLAAAAYSPLLLSPCPLWLITWMSVNIFGVEGWQIILLG
uniref:Uncharacterized protein n=1 Tax=Oryza glumipatula TaxID=40148 RepID=A0A0D9ZJ75_9ORYZ